jgi:hypothetical protein
VSAAPKTPLPDNTHPNIQEILAKRRETLNRVRADLRKVDQLQNDFWAKEEKPAIDPKIPDLS